MVQSTIVNVTDRTTDWNSIKWKNAYRVVRRLRQRIFKATKDGNFKGVRNLQKLLMRSYSNMILSVRRVTQLNQGKKTAGVDKLLVLTPLARATLVDILAMRLPWKALPVKRIYIRKSNGKQRPLGIPGIIDRCLQAIVLNALEPSWEAQFERTSYGFRPGRGVHDAIERVHSMSKANSTTSWVVDADIEGCFDNIAHAPLMQTIGNFPARQLIHQWLKAGYVDKGVFYDTETGVPQGGIISPLLANIALHGMEAALGIRYDKHGHKIGHRGLVRYADDLVVFCKTPEDAHRVVDILSCWMKTKGLALSESKTQIVHLTVGFDFLGFNIRWYQDKNTLTGRKVLIKPSKQSLQDVRDQIRLSWLDHKSHNVNYLIGKLNPIIRGVANYYRTVVSSHIFTKLDRWMYVRQQRYAKRMHPNKSSHWRICRYWGHFNLDRNDFWVFGDKHSGQYLLKFSWFHIKRHTLVKGDASPDDQQLRVYWQQRRKKQSRCLIPSYQKLARRQGYQCPICGESLFNNESLHKHHKIPCAAGGNDSYSNLELVHFYCHQQIHSVGRKSEGEVFVQTQSCFHPPIHSVGLSDESEDEVFSPW
ncbi:group II intron reverse transcriptase/maturase [Nostoc sp. CENA543]|uniref:group II intron reverse transcriptase/maturase n=1 Tax=Nostoc sp. CENA543 TaxID=1869241 RepID=UPI000CA3445D|nr:group II intron reverse transcriptase/maturase [Nostoc sp. CENA543]AUT00207.1 group II intron reverse transcriptase/maturase [Nostoc sp. CENA543]